MKMLQISLAERYKITQRRGGKRASADLDNQVYYTLGAKNQTISMVGV